MTTNTVSQAVAQRDEGPQALITKYSRDFATVLPTHIKPEQWVRLAQGALRKGKRINAPNSKDPDHANHNRFELELAATNNPGVFLAALLDAARLGLEPGTEQYYLTPRKVGGRGGHLEILGIVGYQGHIELMYRAGAISSVVAEVVHGGDQFEYQPGRHDTPRHVIDWDIEDRGPLRLVYAYARMKDGATSKVVVLNKADIARIKKSSQGSDSEYSPWVNHEAAMWLKSAVRQLQKWVPTSAEYIREQARAVATARQLTAQGLPISVADVTAVQQGRYADVSEGLTRVVDAEYTGESEPWPDVTSVPEDEAVA
jgi:recombination protein RecT